MYKTIFWNKITCHIATEQMETKMEKVIDKENEVVKEESEESCGLIFPF